ncbi:4Fe-4S binding protein [bacterium]|nr:4Fe-4S binding protein [bacterium]
MRVSLLRRGVQFLSLLLFLGLLAKTTWPLAPWPAGLELPRHLFLSLDPLAALCVLLSPYRSWAVLHVFWPALVVLAATVVFGRFFCGWLCPLGACIEGADNGLARARKRRTRAVRDVPPHAVKYLLLALVLAAALFGMHLFWVLDPLPAFTRAYAVVLDSQGRDAYNAMVPLLREVGLRARPVAERPFALAAVTGSAFLLILLGGLIGTRVWCRSLCPLGALLGVVGRLGLWRRRAGEGCNACGRCAHSCPMHAIPTAAPTQTRQAECIQCYECVAACPGKGNTLALGRTPVVSTVDVGRRQLLAAAGTGLAYGGLTYWGIIPRFATRRLIRPPGAIVRGAGGALRGLMTEGEFRSKCLRCGQCMKACITGGLQPAVTEAGLDGFYTPVLKPRVGWCEQSCRACGEVCPSGALVTFSAEEKPFIRIGEAHLDQGRCLAWGMGEAYRECLVCNEHCSYGSIVLVDEDGCRRPYVSSDVCVGCGQCENACPVQPTAAITVSRRGPRV